MKHYLIVTDKPWNKYLAERLLKIFPKDVFTLIDNTGHLFDWLDHFYYPKISKIFVVHCSEKIPKEIYENYETVIFHTSPYKGGSPIQNSILNGIENTYVHAMKCVEEFDSGEIYAKLPINLAGTAEEIFIRLNDIIFRIIKYIITDDVKPEKGHVLPKELIFKRRKPAQSSIDYENPKNLDELHDLIRALDCGGYPKAFLETEHFKFEFTRSSRKVGYLLADVKITEK